MVAKDDARAWLGGDRKGLGCDWNTSLGADAHGRAEAPNVWPPRTIGSSAEGRALLLESQVPSLSGRHVDFAVKFFGVMVFT